MLIDVESFRMIVSGGSGLVKGQRSQSMQAV